MFLRIVAAVVNTALAFLVGIIAWRLYPWICRTWFSGLPEAETPVYGISLLVYFFCVSLWYMLVFPSIFIKKIKGSPSPIFSLSRTGQILLLVGLLIAGASLSFFGFHYLATSPIREMELSQLGITGLVLSPIPIMFCIALISLILWYVVFRPAIKQWQLPGILITVIGIILLTFYIGQLSFYDFTHFAGPIHDILMGVPALTSGSWYGFLSMEFLSFFFRIIPLTLLNLHIVIGALETLGFIAFFLFSLILFKDYRWAVLTLAIGILSNFLVQFGTERNFYPQSTFIRFGLWLPIAILLYWQAGVNNSRWKIIFSILIPVSLSIAFFWTADVGLYILAAYLVSMWFMNLSFSLKDSLRRFIKTITPTIASLIVLFIGLSLLYHPNWSHYWAFAFSFTSLTLFLMPISPSLIPWVLIAIPVVTLSVVLFLRRSKTVQNPEGVTMLFLSCFSLLNFTYYTGSSGLNALHHICLPFLLCAVFLIRKWCFLLKRIGANVGLAGCISCACIMTVPLYPLIGQGMKNYQSKNIITTIDMIRHPEGTEFERFGHTAEGIQQAYGDVLQSGDFAIVSPFDTWYMTIWNVKNKLGSNCLLCYWTPEAAAPLSHTMKTLSVSYVFVDADETGYEGRVSWIFTNEIKKQYRLQEQIGQLRVYKRLQ